MNDYDELDIFVFTLGCTCIMMILVPILCYHLGGWAQ